MEYVAGIDIGGTKCAVVLGRRAGNGEITILDKKAFPTGRRPYSEVLDEFFATVE